MNRRFRSSILDTRVYWSVLHESDHELVVFRIPNDTSIESSWSAFKSAINAACSVLPEVLASHDPDWVADELQNLSQKKSNAWLSYCDAAKRGYEEPLRRIQAFLQIDQRGS